MRASRLGLVDFKFAKALSMEELILPEDHGSFYIRDRYKVRPLKFLVFTFSRMESSIGTSDIW